MMKSISSDSPERVAIYYFFEGRKLRRFVNDCRRKGIEEKSVKNSNQDYANQYFLYEELTNREREVLDLIAQGKSNQKSQKLFITLKTVKTHVSNILAKLGVEDRTQRRLHFKHGLVKKKEGIVGETKYAIIGLGRFGGSICRNFAESGQEVLAIDSNEERVNEYMNIATHAVVGNAQDESMLRSFRFVFDHVIGNW